MYHYTASVIVNSACNEGYEGIVWSRELEPSEVLIPHALAVDPVFQGRGIGRQVVQAKVMFYEDTGWTEYRMYEKNL